jgi:putative ABC transport system permease protein
VNVARQIALALRSLSRYQLRAFFMMAGVAVGIASLTALASVGEATRRETVQQFKRMLGTVDMLSIRPGAGATRGMPTLANVEPTLRFEDARAIAAEIPAAIRVAEMQSAFDVDLSYREKITTPAVFGVAASWADVRGADVALGSALSEEDVAGVARVAVIGADVHDALFADENPLGKVIRIADVPFVVKGVLEEQGAGPGGASLDNICLIPVTTASRRLFKRDYLSSIVVQIRDAERADEVIEDIRVLLRERHRIAASAPDDFTITSPRALLARVTQVSSTLATTLAGVGIVATLIGGAVIMSLMLISVSERRREIGIRRAVGASRRAVMGQFLTESALVSTLGGVFGVAIGLGVALLAATFAGTSPAVMWSAVAGAVLLSVVIGVVFGLQPAWRAANTDPIDALRT